MKINMSSVAFYSSLVTAPVGVILGFVLWSVWPFVICYGASSIALFVMLAVQHLRETRAAVNNLKKNESTDA